MMITFEELLRQYIEFLRRQNKSENTIQSYKFHIEDFMRWYSESFGSPFKKLYRENILDFRAYLLNIRELNGKSINAKLAALIKLNEFLIQNQQQDDAVVSSKDYIKIQTEYASPSTISKKEVEEFRQKILETESKRDYALVTLIAYSGMRISEALDLKLTNIDLKTKEAVVRHGKGQKQRLVILNDKIVNAVSEYLKDRELLKHRDSEYLFISRNNKKASRSRINHIFNKYSDKITPHTLRHFFCSYALENGWSYHEVAAQAGHSNIQTTMIYTNPSRDRMKEKANRL